MIHERVIRDRCACHSSESGDIFHVQAQHLYPHIASRDRREQVFAYWLRSLNERNFHFSQWPAADFKEPARRGRPASAFCHAHLHVPTATTMFPYTVTRRRTYASQCLH